jgi:hypothetical protein
VDPAVVVRGHRALDLDGQWHRVAVLRDLGQVQKDAPLCGAPPGENRAHPGLHRRQRIEPRRIIGPPILRPARATLAAVLNARPLHNRRTLPKKDAV